MTREEEVQAKLSSVRSWLSASEKEAAVLSSQANFAWISAGGRSHIATGEAAGVASVVITRDDAFVLTSNIETRRLTEEELPPGSFSVNEWPWYEPEAADKVLRNICDPSRATSDLGSFGLPIAGEGLVALRFTLCASEIERFRRLGQDAAASVEETCMEATAGQTEHEIAASLASRCVEKDILPLVILVAADDRIVAHRHPLPTLNPFRRTLLVSLSGRRHGLHVSLTRMVCAVSPSDELLRRHRATASVDTRLITESTSGADFGDIFDKAVGQYEKEGFPQEWRLHHQGGLTGYAGREIFAGPATRHVLQAHQAIAWNPSITGAKSEDTILTTEEGPEVVTRTGAWPELTIELETDQLARPALLQRDSSPGSTS